MYFKNDLEFDKCDCWLPAVIGAAALLGSSISNASAQARENERNRKFQQEWNEKNLAFSREQFDYQKQLNANQYQIAAADMAKAGMNPAMANGVSLSSGSYSSGANSNLNNQAPQLDLSPIIELANAKLSSDTQKDVASGNNATSKDVAKIQADSVEKVSENQVKIAEENRKSQELIAANKIMSEEKIASEELTERTRSNKANENREFQKNQDDYGIQRARIDQMKKELDYWYARLREEHNARIRKDILDTINTLETNVANVASSLIRRN